MSFSVTKRLGGYPCCHRQWRDDGHCSYLHGYDRWVELTWDGERDHRGWVVDFGMLGEVKDWLESMFDHTVLVALDDPYLAEFEKLNALGVISMTVTDPTMEGMASTVAAFVHRWTEKNVPTATLVEVVCWENEKNAARWRR
jgi:6-pyruvoyltetrahydropterin/6-carboxytetrahydropterin synthase